MKKLLIAAAIAATAAVSLSAPSQAGYRHHGKFWGHNNYGYVVQIQPRYEARYEDDYCFVKKIRKFDRYGNLIVKRVTVCN